MHAAKECICHYEESTACPTVPDSTHAFACTIHVFVSGDGFTHTAVYDCSISIIVVTVHIAIRTHS